jgi:hypothetical protein
MMTLTIEEIEAWKKDPRTQIVLSFIEEIRKSSRDSLIDMPRSYGVERIALETCRAQGYDEGLSEILKLRDSIENDGG